MKFKKSDYSIIALTCLFLGVAIVVQFYAGKNTKKLLQPENQDVMAVEIESIAKSNENMRAVINQLTADYNDYFSSSNSTSQSYAKLNEESGSLDAINGAIAQSGQGVNISIDSALTSAQMVDLVNALRNIGTDIISINGKRITLRTYIDANDFTAPYTISALGNSSVLESSLTRKGGIIEQIKDKNMNISVTKSDKIDIAAGSVVPFKFAQTS